MARKKVPVVTNTNPLRDPWLEAIEGRRCKQLRKDCATSTPTPVTEATSSKEVDVEDEE